jgi:4-hydroxy-3-methylbut-2-enyl diphosphate reductase
MKITLAKSAGFCFGVRRAVKIALETAVKENHVEMLGDIVHNEEVVKQLEDVGIKKVSHLTPGNNKILLIRAHGAAKNNIEKAMRLRYAIMDATCPMVKEIHNITQKMEQNGYRVIIIGDKNHDEVQGILGNIESKALVIKNAKEIPLDKIKKIKRAAVVVQSTQTPENVAEILKFLKLYIKDLKFSDTICETTKKRQFEINKMALANDVMVIIGSRTSANTKRLYELSKSFNRKSYWIQTYNDIVPGWFKGAKKVGISTGASTPDHTIESVVDYLKSLSGNDRHQ